MHKALERNGKIAARGDRAETAGKYTAAIARSTIR